MSVARFSGGRTGTAPLTWAQRGMWNAIARNPPAHFNFGQVVAVPEGGGSSPAGIDDVARAVGRLMLRHESLRTLVRLRDGEPHQVVMGSGQLPLSAVETGPDSVETTAEALEGELGAGAFDVDTEWPLRAGVVTVDGRARRIVLVYSHLAADGRASRIVAEDLRALLTPGARLADAGPQPLDLAREEQADRGGRTRAAIQFWAAQYRRIPPATMVPVGPAHEPVHQCVALTSAALLAAAELVAARHRVSTSTVLLAAVAARIGAHTGHRLVAISVIASNRLQQPTRRMVCTLGQLGLFVLELPEQPDLGKLLPGSFRAAMQAYRHAHYDQAALEQALAQVTRERGEEVNPYCCFNDLRSVLDATASGGEVPPRDVAAVGGLAKHTTLTWMPHPGPMRCRFCMQVFDGAGGLSVQLQADTRCLPPDQMEAFLRGLERTVVEAATG